jgi:ABC-2 type transport system permease protein
MFLRKNWRAFQTIIVNETVRFCRIWSQTFLPPVITMSLYFLIIGDFIGSQLGNIGHVTFMQYITPGLIIITIITSAYANVVASFFGMRFQRSIEGLLVAPVPNYLILLGYTGGGVLRGLITGVLITIVALFFTHLSIYSFFVTISIAILTAALFSLAGFTNALFAQKFDDIQIVPTFILTPLTYLGGVFYSIKQLSPFWQHVSVFNPIVYIVNAFRYGMLGISDITIVNAFAIVILANVLLFGLNLYLLRQGVGIRT